MPNKLTPIWDKKGSCWSKAVGTYRNLSGKVVSQRFFLGRDRIVADTRLAAIQLRWAQLQAAGEETWTDGALQDLADAGLTKASQRYKRRIQATIKKPENVSALKTQPEAARFIDPNGNIRPELLIEWQKYCMSQMLSTDEATQALLNNVARLWNHEPLTTLERISKLGISPNPNIFFDMRNGFAPVSFNAATDNGSSPLDQLEDQTEATEVEATEVPEDKEGNEDL